MDRIASDQHFEIGVSSIDNQHRELWTLVGVLEERIARRAGLSELQAAFDDLRVHTELHFLHEEEFLATTGFGRAKQHKREHDRLLLILRRFRQSLDTGAISGSPGQHVAFLRSWLSGHIRDEDKPLGIHLNSLGIR